MQIYTRKNSNWKLYYEDLESSESDSGSNNNTESDIDNDE